MHANSGMIPFHHVLQLVAGLDSQCPANLPGMVVCPLLVTLECSIVGPYITQYSLHHDCPLLFVGWQAAFVTVFVYITSGPPTVSTPIYAGAFVSSWRHPG